MGKFKKGVFFGGLLGAGLMWLNTTKKGKEFRGDMLDYAADVYVDVKRKIMESGAWEDMTKTKYVAIVRDVVDKYAVKNDLAQNVKNTVVKLVSAQWKHVRNDPHIKSRKKK